MVLYATLGRVFGGNRHIGITTCNGKTFAKRMYDVFLNMNDDDNDIYYF